MCCNVYIVCVLKCVYGVMCAMWYVCTHVNLFVTRYDEPGAVWNVGVKS